MKLEISDKDKFVAGLEVPLSGWIPKDKSKPGKQNGNWGGCTKLSHIQRHRLKLVDKCLLYGLTYQEIGDILGISKQRVHSLARYGLRDFWNTAEKDVVKHKNMARERDKGRCRICKVEEDKNKRHHLHHIGGTRTHRAENLISLCNKCHQMVEAAKRRGLVKYDKVLKKRAAKLPKVVARIKRFEA